MPIPGAKKQRMAVPPEPPVLTLRCVFFRTEAGNEPVRDWLRDEVSQEARKAIGADILTVQQTWPVGKPLVDSVGEGLREVRSTHDKVEYRVFFALDGSTMVLLHGIKKDRYAEDEASGSGVGERTQSTLGESAMNKFEGSTFESLLEETGELEEVKARATKQVLAIQAERRMRELGLTTTGLATRMRTSRNQIHRILDREDAGITLKMLFRLAEALALPLVVTLGEGTANVGGVSRAPGQGVQSKSAPSGPRKAARPRTRRRLAVSA